MNPITCRLYWYAPGVFAGWGVLNLALAVGMQIGALSTLGLVAGFVTVMVVRHVHAGRRSHHCLCFRAHPLDGATVESREMGRGLHKRLDRLRWVRLAIFAVAVGLFVSDMLDVQVARPLVTVWIGAFSFVEAWAMRTEARHDQTWCPICRDRRRDDDDDDDDPEPWGPDPEDHEPERQAPHTVALHRSTQ